ncbi:MAG: HAD family hydrolase [Fimbriimonadaceae bacterium]|jgi:D-glycero-D-manno-heptose 1,7-bisphosphate phosphatase|nr:HAD family hydrolase [Fimbriimonadaceae bacterium]
MVGLASRIRKGCDAPQEHKPVLKPVAFLDRDGVINIDRAYVAHQRDWQWVTRAIEAVEWLYENGYWVIVVTNQSGIARDYYRESQFRELSLWLLQHVEIDAIYFCPHGPESSCPARKPGTGMLARAAAEFATDLSRSFLLGDKLTDLEAAEAFGILGRHFSSGDLLEAVQETIRSLENA